MKLLSIAVPCYNSEGYMERCIKTLLKGGDEVEILLINDGSTDGTAEIADSYQEKYPDIVRAIHQPNKGHGGAVNTGIENATGKFFKVVDSDDKLNIKVFDQVLDVLRGFAEDDGLDMLISNFVYDKEGVRRKKIMQYRSCIPRNRIFTWHEAGRFKKGQYILMHSVIYRTEILRQSGLRLPEHTFYVDNIYVFQPMPYARNMYYLDVNFYMYFIGRDDQSVNETVMISRLDQQTRVNRLMFDYYADPTTQEIISEEKPLKRYMYNYLEIITVVSSILAILSGTPEHLQMKDELWQYFEEQNPEVYKKLRYGLFGRFLHLPGEGGRRLQTAAYNVARKIFNFN
ncbi:MAG: glycosyltransferase [Lachnospiraceae bacterium]|nr:glycosyltransferase [Lachnospiraceae bacterium]